MFQCLCAIFPDAFSLPHDCIGVDYSSGDEAAVQIPLYPEKLDNKGAVEAGQSAIAGTL